MFARGHNGRLESWPPGRKPSRKITPAKRSLRATLQKALLRAVRAKFHRRRKTQKPKKQRENRRRGLFKRNLRRKRRRAAWRPERLRRGILPASSDRAWGLVGKAKAWKL